MNQQRCKIINSEQPNICQFHDPNYPKISKIKPLKNYVLFNNVICNRFQTLLNPHLSLASCNFSMRKEIKILLTDVFVTLEFLLFMKTFFAKLWLANLTVIFLPFWRIFLLIRCARSISDDWRCSLIMLLIT